MTTTAKKGTGRVTEAFLAQAGKGRTKGVPNKVTAAAKSVIAEAAEELGGVARLVAWAKSDDKNEAAFWTTIYPKLIPVQVTGEDGGSIKIEQVKNDADAFAGRIASLVAAGSTGSGTGQVKH